MKEQTMGKNLTEGSIPKLLLRFVMPLFLSNLLQALYNLVDLVVVGNVLGKNGMGAVSIGGDVLHLMTFIAMGFSSAGQVLIAQDVGAKNRERIKKTIGTLFTLLLLASLVMMTVCLLLRRQILSWLNTPAEVFDYALDYLVTCMAGLCFIYGYNCVSAILRGMGDSRRPFVFVAIAAVLNTALDLLFVAVLGLEVFGAALATVIGQGLSFVVSLIYLVRRREQFGFDFRLQSFVPEKKTLKRLLALGIPMSVQSAAVSSSKIVLAGWINLGGSLDAALAGVYNKINTMGGVLSSSFVAAGGAMVGQNLGAGKPERVPRVLLTIGEISLSIAAAVSLCFVLFPDALFRVFTGDQEVLAAAGILVCPIIINFFGCATRSIAFGLINGSGHTRLNLAVALIDGLLARIGLAAFMGFALEMGSLGCWLGDAVAGFVPICIGIVFFAGGRWKRVEN